MNTIKIMGLPVVQSRDKYMLVSPPKPYCAIQIRDKCMAVSPPKPYSHTNKRQMYDSQFTQALLSYK